MRSVFAPIAAVFAALTLAACASTPDVPAFTPQAPRTAWIVNAEGAPLGQAIVTEAPKGVLIRLEFSQAGLQPGWHGLHIHQIGDCRDFASGFQASAAHVGHTENGQHGLMNPAGPEQGDLPNLFVPPGGPYAAEFYSPWLTLGSVEVDGRMPLIDADGSALVIHANADDHASQPIGGAGARLACAAFTAIP